MNQPVPTVIAVMPEQPLTVATMRRHSALPPRLRKQWARVKAASFGAGCDRKPDTKGANFPASP